MIVCCQPMKADVFFNNNKWLLSHPVFIHVMEVSHASHCCQWCVSKFQMTYKWSFNRNYQVVVQEKKHPASRFRGEKCLLHKIWILHHCKSFQNAPEGLKCVMIGLSCKWSLTFHSMSRLSSLMATAPQRCYVRDIHPGVAWLAHWEEHFLRAKFRFGAKDCGCRQSPHIYSSAVAGLCNICQRERGPLISA